MEEKFFRVLLGGLMASSVPRGRPLGPDTSVRVEIRSTKDHTHLHVDESDEASRVSSFLSLTVGVRWHTLVPKLQMPAEIREKDRIRRLRLCQYLTRAGKVAILGTDFGNPEHHFGNPHAIAWQPWGQALKTYPKMDRMTNSS